MKERCYFGDIHNHCNASYAHGTVDDALYNASLQLDFASVTGHSSWPDIMERTQKTRAVVDYHLEGFARLKNGWDEFVAAFDRYNIPGKFVCFPSYEIHSSADGDHTVYMQDFGKPMYQPASIGEFQDIVRTLRETGSDAMLVPHHIAYAQGFRGINWRNFDEVVSPLVEIMSMHGCAESDSGPYPYLHTMGPRNGGSTMQAGLALGHHFGVIGSTDHHSAHPGSHGYGRVGIWADTLDFPSIWHALKARRCFALTGDKIALDFRVNSLCMGQVGLSTGPREIHVEVSGGDAIDYIEVLRNNQVINRWSYPDGIVCSTNPHGTLQAAGTLQTTNAVQATNAVQVQTITGKLLVEVGWGELGKRIDWDIEISLDKGHILGVEPRLHGVDVVDPEQKHAAVYRFSKVHHEQETVRLATSTWGNPTPLTNANQGICLEIEADLDALATVCSGNTVFSRTVRELLVASASCYTGEFLSGAIHLHRFVPACEYTKCENWSDLGSGEAEDWYYVRVRQKNNQWAFSSPIWVQNR